AGQQVYVHLPDSRPAGGQAAGRKGKYRVRFVQIHDAVHVTGVGALQKEPVQVLRLPRTLSGSNAIHVRSFGRDIASHSLLPRLPTSSPACISRGGPAGGQGPAALRSAGGRGDPVVVAVMLGETGACVQRTGRLVAHCHLEVQVGGTPRSGGSGQGGGN